MPLLQTAAEKRHLMTGHQQRKGERPLNNIRNQEPIAIKKTDMAIAMAL